MDCDVVIIQIKHSVSLLHNTFQYKVVVKFKVIL